MSGDVLENRRSTRSTKGLHTKRQLDSPSSPGTPSKPGPREKPTFRSDKHRAKRARRDGPSQPEEETPPSPQPLEVLDILPQRLVENSALPTTSEPQSLNVPNADFQTIIESAVLSASLDRSRKTWLSGVNFTKFVARTIHKKPKDRTAEDKEAMARDKQLLKSLVTIGDCQLTFDPHIFGVVLYTTKEAVASANHRANLHNHKGAMRFGQQPGYSFAPPVYSSNYPSPMPYNVHSHPNYAHQRSTAPHMAAHQSNSASGAPQKPQPGRPTDQHVHGNTSHTTQQAAPDPVIHMLAQRAGTDPELKAVMKIVAAGKATPQQLEYFQGHITELTQMLEARKAAAQHARQVPPTQPARKEIPADTVPHKASPPQQVPRQPDTNVQETKLNASQTAPQEPKSNQKDDPTQPNRTENSHPKPPDQNSTPSAQTNKPTNNNPYNTLPPSNTAPYPYTHPPPPQIQSPPLRPVYFEFSEAPGERLTFPSNSILEYLPGGRMVRFSFLIVRRPQSPVPPGYDPKKEYYQCVTGSLFARNAHILEHLSRAVKPPDEVRRYMEEIFEKCERADQRTLALRLPRSQAGNIHASLEDDMASGVEISEKKWARKKYMR